METTKPKDRQWVIELFDKHIYSHIIGDLKLMDELQPHDNQNTCAIPTAMLILSALDFIGFLLRKGGKKDESEENIKTAFTYNGYFADSYSTEIVQDLIRIYRHGIMHNFYPIQKHGKIYGIHKSDKQSLFEMLFEDDQAINSLNINVLSQDFKSFIDSLYHHINTKKDSQIIANIISKYSERQISKESPTVTTQTTIPPGILSSRL